MADAAVIILCWGRGGVVVVVAGRGRVIGDNEESSAIVVARRCAFWSLRVLGVLLSLLSLDEEELLGACSEELLSPITGTTTCCIAHPLLSVVVKL